MTAKSLFIKYRLIPTVIAIIILVILIALFRFVSTTFFIVFLLALFLWRIIDNRLEENLTKTVLHDNFDPQLLKEVRLYMRRKTTTYNADPVLEAYLGNYQPLITVATDTLKKRGLKKNKYNALAWLARIYFELGDTEKLQLVINKFESMILQERNQNKVRARYGIMSLFKNYLNKEYVICKEDCQERIRKVTINILKIRLEFYEAIIDYRLGDIDAAKRKFESTIQKAPKLNYASLSQKYLNAIEENSLHDGALIEVLPSQEKSYNIFGFIYKVLGVIGNVLAVIGVCIILYSCCQDYYYNSLLSDIENAIEVYYDNFEVLTVVQIPIDEESFETLCVFELADGTLSIASMALRDGETVCARTVNGIAPKETSILISPVNNTPIVFRLYDDKKEIPSDAQHSERIKTKNGVLYFVILDA